MKKTALIGFSSLAAVFVFGAATTAFRVTSRRQNPKRRARLNAMKTDAANAIRRRTKFNGLRNGAKALRELGNRHFRFHTA